VPWLVRVLWALLPFTAGPALADALSGASVPVRTVASVGLWAGWAVGVAATAVAHPLSLTVLRVLAPAAAAAVAGAAVAGEPSALAAGWALVVLSWAFSPAFGAHCVNGPAYPNERRYLLRVPGPLLAGPLVLAWALTVAGATAGPLWLAAGQWVAGGLALLAGVPLGVVLARSLHNLSRRWAVFVPAGLVLHDPITLVDPVLLRRQDATGLHPTPRPTRRRASASASLDLTQGAPGLALEIVLKEPVPLTLVKPGTRQGEPAQAAGMVFTPTRPGAVLDEARARNMRVG
jgi:hypothetical protein